MNAWKWTSASSYNIRFWGQTRRRTTSNKTAAERNIMKNKIGGRRKILINILRQGGSQEIAKFMQKYTKSRDVHKCSKLQMGNYR